MRRGSKWKGPRFFDVALLGSSTLLPHPLSRASVAHYLCFLLLCLFFLSPIQLAWDGREKKGPKKDGSNENLHPTWQSIWSSPPLFKDKGFDHMSNYGVSRRNYSMRFLCCTPQTCYDAQVAAHRSQFPYKDDCRKSGPLTRCSHYFVMCSLLAEQMRQSSRSCLP
jgi:hypothetical protein